MKKIISSIIAICLAVQTFVLPVYAARMDWASRAEGYGAAGITLFEDRSILLGIGEDFPETEESAKRVVTVAYNKLNSLGIVKGDAYDTPTDDNGIERAAFVQMAVRALNMENSAFATDMFIDVSKDHYAYNEIGVAINMGLVSGHNGYFRASDKITYNEALAVLVHMLGLKEDAVRKGGYPGGYMTVAHRTKIISGLDITDMYAVAKTEDLYRMMVNTIESPDYAVLQGVWLDNYKYRTGESILEYYHNVYKVKGVIDAVGMSNLYSNTKYSNNTVKMGNMLFEGDYDEYIDYLGLHSEVLYRVDENTGKKEVVCINATATNQIVIMNAEDAAYSNGTYTYVANGKTYKKTLANGASLVYNGKVSSAGIANPYDPEMGYITLISNDESGAFNVVKVDAIEDVIIGSVTVGENPMIYDLFDKDIKISADIEDTSKIISIENTDGVEIYPSMLSTKTILSVQRSADGDILYATASNDKVSGKIETIINDSGYLALTMNETEYRITNRCNSECSKLLTAGNEVTLFLNGLGDVAYIEAGLLNAESSLKYAYVIQARLGNELGDELTVKLLNADGTITRDKFAKIVSIDGVRAKSDNEKLEKLNVGLTYGKAVMLEKNEDGLITKVDTAYVNPNTEAEKNSLRAVMNDTIYNDAKTKRANGDTTILLNEENTGGIFHKGATNGGIFSESIYWTKERTVVFRINPSASSEEEMYRVETLTYPYNNDTYYKDPVPEIYRNTDSYYADAIVHTDTVSSGGVASQTLYVVKSMRTAIYNGDTMTMLVLTSNGTNEKKVYIEPSRLSGLGIKNGDVIICDTIGDKVSGNNIAKQFDYETKTKSVGGQWFNDIFRRVAAYVYDVDNGLVVMYETNNEADMANLKEENIALSNKVIINSFANTPITKVSTDSDGRIKVESASMKEFKPYSAVGQNSTRILVSYKYMALNQIFIFE